MQLPDLVNGMFEAFGGLSICMHVQQIMRDKRTRGVSAFATAFFTVWGLWNLFYYPHLGQWLSFAGGLFITLANTVWLIFMWRYRKS